MADGDKATRCAFTSLGIEIEKPLYANRKGYMKPWDHEKGPIKHVQVLWDGVSDWKLYNTLYIRKA